MKTKLLLICLIALNCTPTTEAQVNISVDTDQPAVPMSQDLIGVFFEDINYAADGGLYAELVQNRSFEYYVVDGYTSMGPLTAWSVVQEGGASVALSVVGNQPLNQHNTKCLKLLINNQGTAAGVKNTGFDGIALEGNEYYDFSIYLKRDTDYDQAVVVQLKSSGGYVFASDTIAGTSAEWQQYKLTLQSKLSLVMRRCIFCLKALETSIWIWFHSFPRKLSRTARTDCGSIWHKPSPIWNHNFSAFPEAASRTAGVWTTPTAGNIP
ncbi:MAG: hypothetical protein M0P23_07530 [Bacteroidales bacterium]|nr:hypothetical protein [Bacteroidales bacterium]